MTTKKLTFAEAQAEVQAAKNNSDLANLAQGLENITLARQELEELEAEIRGLVSIIEAGFLVPVGAVHDAYDKARGAARGNL